MGGALAGGCGAALFDESGLVCRAPGSLGSPPERSWIEEEEEWVSSSQAIDAAFVPVPPHRGGRGGGEGPLYFNSAAGFRGYSILYSMYFL